MSVTFGARPYELFYKLGLYRLAWHSDGPMPELVAWHDAGKLPRGAALDIGCGAASNALWLAGRGYRATAIDFAAHAILLARKRAAGLSVPVELRVVDVTRGDPALGRYDLLFDRECLQDLRTPDERQAYARNALGWLAPGGVLMVSTWLYRDDAERRRWFPLSRLAEEEIPSLFPSLAVEERLLLRKRICGFPGWHAVYRLRRASA